ncbi:hypothetical protein BGZ97_006965 [Linnemannia gamsii]|jgi:hypothetical protein|uniref:Uncharacterized protein n=1 Tax=Linnemannia gamsii TaxID=64522 RepID=A0A9P6UFH8_9FUNG|nr:hypothetical protein BGZ97_006965 [Linnemannia gamsii]
MASTAALLITLGIVILGLLLVLRGIKKHLYNAQAGNGTPSTPRPGGFIVLNSQTPNTAGANTANNSTSNNKSTGSPFMVTDNFKKAPKPASPKITMKLNGALVIEPQAPAPVSSTKPAAPTFYKPPAVPSVWGASTRTNPPSAQQPPIISPSPVSLPPTEYTNSVGIRLQVAPTASPSTAVTPYDIYTSRAPPAYAQAPQGYRQAHTTITIDDQIPAASTSTQPRNPQQQQQQQQPDALGDIQFSSHPRPSVAIVINADESENIPASTTI